MLSKDFEAGTDVVKRKIKQVRALNHVVKTMRGKIQDLDLDPVELKVDRDQWRHEAKALKLQVAKLKEDRDHWEHQANFFRLERDELKDLDASASMSMQFEYFFFHFVWK